MAKSLHCNLLSVNIGYFRGQSFKIFLSFGSSDWSTDPASSLLAPDLVTSFLEYPQFP